MRFPIYIAYLCLYNFLLNCLLESLLKGLPVSGPAGKELRTCYSILTTSKNLTNWKNQYFFLDESRKWGHREATDSKTGEKGRWIQRVTTYWSRNLNGNHYLTGKSKLCWWIAGGGHVRGLKTPGGAFS